MKLSKIAEITGDVFLGEDVEIHGLTDHFEYSNRIVSIYDINNIPKDSFKYGAILTRNNLKEVFKGSNLLISENPRLSFAKLTKIFIETEGITDGELENTLVSVGCNVQIGKNFNHGRNVVIENNVKLGNNVSIGHNVVIHKNTIIGNNVIIGSGTIIGSEGFGNVLDDKNDWHHIHHLGGVIIGDNVSIDSNCTIDKGTIDNTIIESGVIIDNLVHIAHNVFIGKNTAIAAKVGIAGSCNIGKRNMIGGMVGIVDHITTANDVIISATSTVNKDIMESGRYTGIIPISKHSSWKRIAFWITKLDKIVKKFNIKKI